MAASAVLKVKPNALVLEHAHDKVSVALAVLHAVIPAAVTAAQVKAALKRVGAQHLLDHVGHAEVLKNSVILALGGVPQLGAQAGAVKVLAAVFAQALKLGALAVEVAYKKQ